MKKLIVGIFAVAALSFGMNAYAQTPDCCQKKEQKECCKKDVCKKTEACRKEIEACKKDVCKKTEACKKEIESCKKECKK